MTGNLRRGIVHCEKSKQCKDSARRSQGGYWSFDRLSLYSVEIIDHSRALNEDHGGEKAWACSHQYCSDRWRNPTKSIGPKNGCFSFDSTRPRKNGLVWEPRDLPSEHWQTLCVSRSPVFGAASLLKGIWSKLNGHRSLWGWCSRLFLLEHANHCSLWDLESTSWAFDGH